MTHRSSRAPHPSRRRWGALLGAVSMVASTMFLSTPAAQAAPVTLTPLSTDTFAGAATSSPNWKLVTAAGSARPCLTAGTDTAQTPVPGCAPTAIDAVGAGTLRLTNNSGGQGGTVYNTISIPTSAGIDVSFDTYQYNGSGADGIAFILAAADPDNPTAPSVNGPVGGSLGYSGSAGGVSFGYLGFGLDVYGNFSSPGASGSGCPGTDFAAQTVVVRGPGNGTTGYCKLAAQATSGVLDARSSVSRPTAVPVQIALNPTGTATTTASGVGVPAASWMITWTGIGGSRQTMTGALPTAARMSQLGFPAGYYNPTTGLPYQLTFGWSAATGGSTEIHEIHKLASTTLTGQLPVYRLAITDDQGGRFVNGGSATVAVTPSLDPAQGSESEAATVTTTFPTGLTPTNPTTPGYVCSTSGQVVSCRYTPATPVAAGASLPTLQIPVRVTAAAGSSPVINAKVSSLDGNPQTATRTVNVVAFTASATPASVGYGTGSTLSVSGLPASATGTVTFRSGTTALCTATLPAISCTSPAGLLPATYPVTATYSGDGTHSALTATTSYTVTRAASAVTAAVGAATVPYGTAQNLLATVAPAGATGAVTFRTAGGTVLCTVADIAVASGCAASATLEPGDYQVTAAYAGDTRFAAGTSAPVTFTVARAEAPFSAAAASATSTYGTPNTLSYSGLPAGATGAVTFTSGSRTLCTVPDVTTATGCATPADLPAGSYPVTAAYSGDGHFLGSTADAAFTVALFPTDLAVAVTDASVPFGTTTTLSFSGVPAGATGTVVFTTGDTELCRVDVTEASGCATPIELQAGEYPVQASYSGDADHESDTATTTFTVTQAGVTTFTAGVSDTEPVYGSSVTLSFSGVPAGGTGSVIFRSGSTVLCTIDDVTSTSSCVTSAALGAGGYPVTATYSGDRNFEAVQATTAFTVDRASTAVTAAVSADETAFGSPVTLSFAGLPTGAVGSVTFSSGGTVLCTVADITVATSCAAPADLDVDSYDVTAVYPGDDDHLGSDAGTAFAVIPVRSVDFAASATPATVPFGTAPVLSYLGLVPGATGSVVFRTGDVVLCTVTDVTAATSCTAPVDSAVGTYPVTASFSGDANRAPATATTTFTVVKADVTPVVSLGLSTITYGGVTTLGVSGLPAGATGSVTFTTGDRVLCTITDVTAAGGCSSPTGLNAGSYPVVATYLGDAGYNAGVSAAVELIVVKAPSAVTVQVAPSPAIHGTSATLSLGSLPAGATGGSATFTAGDRVLCTVADVTVAPGSCQAPADLGAGTYPVTGVWAGDANHLGSTGGGVLVVARAATTLRIVVPPVTFGENAVPRIDGLPAGATGTVTVTTGDTLLCTLDVATGTGCEAFPALPAGTYAVDAVYSGDANHDGSTAAGSVTVAPQPITFAVSVPDAVYGAVPAPVIEGLPAGTTGTLTFTSGGTVLCVLDVATGTGCENLAGLGAGDYDVTVAYSGDADHLPFTTTTRFSVARATAPVGGPAGGETAVAGNGTTLSVGTLPPGATGTVAFVLDGVTLCTVTLPATSCEVPAGLPAGVYDIQVLYSGDTNYGPTASATTLTVTAAAPTPTVPPTPVTPVPLAYTGASVTGWGAGGALLLVLGGLLVVGARRRGTAG